METERLRHFRTVAENGSLSKASEMLGISIGGLSKSIKSLESEIGFELFQPVGRGIVITEDGKRIYGQALQILESIQKIKSRTNAPSPFRIAALEVFTVCGMGSLLQLASLKQSVEILEANPGQIESLVMQDRVSYGLTYLPFPQPGLESLSLGSFQLGAYVVNKKFQSLPLAEVPFIVPATGLSENPLGIQERDGWPEELLERKKQYRVNMLSTALDLTRQGLGAVYIPEFVAEFHNQTQDSKFRLEPLNLPREISKIKRKLFLIKRESIGENSEIKRLSAAIRKTILS